MNKRIWALAAVLLFVFSGCYTVKQSGSRIITNAPFDLTVQYTKKVLTDKGYLVVSEADDPKLGKLLTVKPNNATTLKNFKNPEAEVLVAVRQSPTSNQVFVDTTLKKNDAPPEITEDQAKQIAKTAVDEILQDYKLFGEFRARKNAEYRVQGATPSKLKQYLTEILSRRSYTTSDLSTQGLKAVKNGESPYHGAFNLESVISGDSDPVISLAASQKAYLNPTQTQLAMDQEITEIVSLLGQYPIATQVQTVSFKSMEPNLAEQYAISVLKQNKYQINSSGEGLIKAVSPEGVKVEIQVSQDADQTKLNIAAASEGSFQVNKSALQAQVDAEADKISKSLGEYQVYASGSRTVDQLSQKKIADTAVQILKRLGYQNIKTQDLQITAQLGKQPTHKAVINYSGADQSDLSVSVLTLINEKPADLAKANKLVQTRLQDILKAFDRYQKQERRK